ncbi:MAG: hypothetical protein QN141_07660 [Armatimonadota bacterium]|nr:hypothetical protein [Armatimonadota bacterium]MDR7450265.1 hypothetical protein [Armatimonadota bacterium]MDR7467152.1 hypothetical protein [Armatimonadota bacterium]MDR7493306.1 hypothetical protein [Armatimonadota bacterium]MDR7500155.1 hypothetical protein [Armatimonadota bacterium]
MVYYDAVDGGPSRFQRFDSRLQTVLIGWTVSVTLFVLAVHLLVTNARLLSIGP